MPTRKKIGELLIESGAATENDVKTALGQQRAFGSARRLGEVMVSLKMITPTALARALAAQHDLPFIQLPEIPAPVSALVPVDFQSEHRLIPFRLETEGKSERIHLALEDPSQLEVVDELRFQLRRSVRVYVAASDDIENTLAILRGDREEVLEPVALEDGEGEEMQIDRGHSMATGGWFATPGQATDAAAKAASLDWDLPAPTPGSGGPKPAAAEAPKPAAPPPAAPKPAPQSSAQDDLDDLFGTAAPPQIAEPSGAKPASVPVVSFASARPPVAVPAGATLLPEPKADSAPAPAPAPPAAVRAPAPPPPSAAVPRLTPAVPVASAPGASMPPGLGAAPAPTTATPAPAGAVASAPAAAAAKVPALAADPSPVPQAPTDLVRRGLEISENDLRILDDLERMAGGSEPALETEKVRPARMVASLIRLLIRKGVIHELEFLEELARK